MRLEEFRQVHVAPATARRNALEEEVAEGEAELTKLIGALPYDDAAAAAAQIRLEYLYRDLGRWRRRLAFLAGRQSAGTGAGGGTGGFVEVG